MSYTDPYASSSSYQSKRPRYLVGDQPEEEHVAEHLRAILTESIGSAVELGCGDGRYTTILAGLAGRVLAADPSQAMVEACRRRLAGSDNVEVRKGSASEVLDEMSSPADLVASFWSITYPLQEPYDVRLSGDGRVRQYAATSAADQAIENFVRRLLERTSTALFCVYFEPDSIEQKWVTRTWSRIGEFPGGSRNHVLAQFERVLSQNKAFRTVFEKVNASLVTSQAELAKVFLELHLRNLVPPGETRESLSEDLLHDMESFREGEMYRIPAGWRVCSAIRL